MLCPGKTCEISVDPCWTNRAGGSPWYRRGPRKGPEGTLNPGVGPEDWETRGATWEDRPVGKIPDTCSDRVGPRG